MKTDEIKDIVINDKYRYFVQCYGSRNNTRGGWKLSIQGRTIGDLESLIDKSFDYLDKNNFMFKYATPNLIALKHETQSTKFLTVYCPDDMDIYELAKNMSEVLVDYKGGVGFTEQKMYEYFCDGIFIRNDRDENGTYIPV